MSSLALCSGGLDSVTLAYRIAAEGDLSALISFDYGQRHRKELDFAAKAAESLGVVHEIADLSGLVGFFASSALTGDPQVPDGHYRDETMKVTVVPNRNAIMLTLAFGLAADRGYGRVAAAFHGGDHFIYPDCREAFVEAFQAMQNKALEDLCHIALYTPFVRIDKAAIVQESANLKVPFAQTWSCYKGGDRHCGRCGTCVERREAFYLAGIADPTDYEDRDFWRRSLALKNAETDQAG
jgi:7-cyano-7-deazaguanine synthase